MASGAESAKSPAQGISSARRTFALHGWLGLSLGLPLLVICLSGALAVFGHEIDWLVTPAMRVQPQGQRASLDAILTRVQSAFPDAKVSYWEFQCGPRFADELTLYPRDAPAEGDVPTTRVFVNPYTGGIQGVGGYLNVRTFLRAFHYYWFDRVTGWGFYLVAAFAFVLLGSVLTGMTIYKRWWAGLFTLRIGRGRRIFFSDLHKLCGSWTLVFNFLIALTAIYYLVEWNADDWEMPTPKLSSARVAQIAPDARPLPLETQIANARQAFPDLQIANMALPESHEDPLYFDGQATAWFVRERGNKLLLDPFDGSVVHQHRAEEMSAGHRWVDTVDTLHFGTFGGLFSKIVWCVLGLALPVLILTGAWIGLRRAGPQSWMTLRNLRNPLNAAGLIASFCLLLFATLSTIHSVRKMRTEIPLRPQTDDVAFPRPPQSSEQTIAL